MENIPFGGTMPDAIYTRKSFGNHHGGKQQKYITLSLAILAYCANRRSTVTDGT
jgi:hypothetical protein